MNSAVDISGISNADAFHNGIIPCETNPSNGDRAMLKDEFHGRAIVTVGSKQPFTHVCLGCADKWHEHKKRREGLHYE